MQHNQSQHADERRRQQCRHLKKGPVIAPGLEQIAFSDLKFKTPSGKIELFSEQAKEKWGVNKLPDYIETFENIKDGTGEARPQFYFLTPNTKNRIHSQFGNLKVIKQFEPEPLLEINPEDASELNIKNGGMVKVLNKYGELIIKVNYNFGIRRGCVSTPNGWWRSEGGGGNLLTAPRETDLGHGTAFHDNLVYIENIIDE